MERRDTRRIITPTVESESGEECFEASRLGCMKDTMSSYASGLGISFWLTLASFAGCWLDKAKGEAIGVGF